MNTRQASSANFAISLGATALILSGCSAATGSRLTTEVEKGDMSHHGGTPTIRKSFRSVLDDPTTSNDESNDQPIGHFGTTTIYVCNASNGNIYTLDADVEGSEVQRIYFPKGGWVDFDTSDIDETGNGTGTDEEGREWMFQGYTSSTATAESDSETENTDDEEG